MDTSLHKIVGFSKPKKAEYYFQLEFQTKIENDLFVMIKSLLEKKYLLHLSLHREVYKFSKENPRRLRNLKFVSKFHWQIQYVHQIVHGFSYA